MDPNRLTDLQLDALREVTNIGCGAAATALSQLLGGRGVSLEVTRSAMMAPRELVGLFGGPDCVLAGLHVTLRGGFEGHLLLAYPDAQARALAGLLAGPAASAGDGLSEMGQSALMEVGNIVSSAYLNGVGRVSGLMLLPSVPTLVHDRAEAVIEVLADSGADAAADRMLVLETRLHATGTPAFDGHVVIVPRPEGLGVLLEAIGMGG
jgi:chemotaxis protein CheC